MSTPDRRGASHPAGSLRRASHSLSPSSPRVSPETEDSSQERSLGDLTFHSADLRLAHSPRPQQSQTTSPHDVGRPSNHRQGCRTVSQSAVGVPPSVDLHALDYLSQCDDNLLCPICHSPLVQPVRLRCDHLFCRECLVTALDHQPKDLHNCPSCRSVMESDIALPAPRIVVRMLDELKVKCPNRKLGCKDTVARGFIVHHVVKYCDFQEVECQSEGCSLKVPRKDAKKSCLHKTVVCADCSEEIMEKDVERHQLERCRGRITCPHCEGEQVRCELEAHIRECPDALLPCAAKRYGCPYSAKRSELEQHLASCALVKLGPFLQEQNARLEAHDAALKYLQEKNEILESSICTIQATLGSNAVLGSTLLDTRLSAPPAQLLDLSPAVTAALPPDNPPFDSATHHLLSLHESLREEVDRVSAALSELDAKSSMMLMNESLRAKEEMAHTNAAVNAMRMQLHWLMSARLQSQSRTSGSTPIAGSSTGPRDGPLGTTAGPGLPVRRLSDVMRQETKL